MRNWDYLSPEDAKNELIAISQRFEEEKEQAVAAEREACAKEIEAQTGIQPHITAVLAALIRARGEA